MSRVDSEPPLPPTSLRPVLCGRPKTVGFALEHRKFFSAKCQSARVLEVHHRSRERERCEKIVFEASDLIGLCRQNTSGGTGILEKTTPINRTPVSKATHSRFRPKSGRTMFLCVCSEVTVTSISTFSVLWASLVAPFSSPPAGLPLSCSDQLGRVGGSRWGWVLRIKFRATHLVCVKFVPLRGILIFQIKCHAIQTTVPPSDPASTRDLRKQESMATVRSRVWPSGAGVTKVEPGSRTDDRHRQH